MLQSIGKVSLLVRLLKWICVCVRKDRLDDELRARIRPWLIARFACWCDRVDQGA